MKILALIFCFPILHDFNRPLCQTAHAPLKRIVSGIFQSGRVNHGKAQIAQTRLTLAKIAGHAGLIVDFPARFAAARGLGWDLTRSWINAQLHPSGVQRVHLTAPATDTVINAEQCVALGAVEIAFGGRDR